MPRRKQLSKKQRAAYEGIASALCELPEQEQMSMITCFLLASYVERLVPQELIDRFCGLLDEIEPHLSDQVLNEKIVRLMLQQDREKRGMTLTKGNA